MFIDNHIDIVNELVAGHHSLEFGKTNRYLVFFVTEMMNVFLLLFKFMTENLRFTRI